MVLNTLSQHTRGQFALLIDPDKNISNLTTLVKHAEEFGVDLILVGGSLVRGYMDETILLIKKKCSIPVVLFPGSVFQFSPHAHAILLLSLISGRNPEFLIGNHVIAAQAIRDSGMEVIPTGYMLIGSGEPTSVQYISNTMPIPRSKTDIAVATALAGEQLGLKVIYLEGGSGADEIVPPLLVQAVCSSVGVPVVVGGGIRSPGQVKALRHAGASMVVVGNAIESNPELFQKLVEASR
ncbi:MAG: geranylgeranylglyceryl/heptaprenylglyceryl phosphate synthase [Tenuifilaceae bacterium]|jgi:putative glycerol-1-phosphate prenyltransferase|nr:geranylgeranylglyceryl/heptaprenylglyceryl phosphate synthase [Tenuifilaceae bacterium]